jgi:predicted PurR-regulated permease PerM
MAEPISTDRLTRTFFVVGLILVAVIFLDYGSGIFIPLAVALLVWFLINAVAASYQRVSLGGFRLPRAMAIALSLATILIGGFLMVNVVVTNVGAMSADGITFQDSLNPLIDQFAELFNISDKDVLNDIFDKIGFESLLSQIVSSMASFASQLGVVVIYVLFLMVEQQFFDAKLRALVRDEARRTWINGMLQRVAKDVQSYIWIMTLVSAMTAGLSYFVMVWVGLDYAPFWAFLIFVLNFIPTIGSIVSTIFPCAFALIQFQRFGPAIVLLVVIGVIQFMIGNILQPRLAGQMLNMSGFIVILALFAWGAIWGIAGMFLAVPITAILMIVMSNFQSTRPVAILMSQAGSLDDMQEQIPKSERA